MGRRTRAAFGMAVLFAALVFGSMVGADDRHIPTGEPGDPFRITVIEGDGWRMLDSGPGLIAEGSINWIDNDRVLFRGINRVPAKSRSELEANPKSFWLYLWDVRHGISRHWDTPLHFSTFCHSDGEVVIPLLPRNRREGTYAVGSLGGEWTEVVVPAQPGKDLSTHWNPFSCRVVPRPPGLEGHFWYPLRDGDGVLDFGERADKYLRRRKTPPAQTVRLVRSDGEIVKTLPFSTYDVGHVYTAYYPHKKAYFVFDGSAGHVLPDRRKETRHERWRRTNCVKAWWLWPDGSTEETCIPAGPWTGGASWGAMPTAKGLFIWSHNHKSGRDPGAAGGYLVGRDGIQKIVSGHLRIRGSKHEARVAPNGCRIAFSYAPSLSADLYVGPGPRTVRILDLCADDRPN